MPIAASLIKKPYEVSFSGNPMYYSFGLSPYGSVERTQDIRLVITVLVESFFGSNNFVEIKSQTFYPNEKGQVEFDIKKYIHAYLEYYTPAPTLMRPVQCINQRKRYRVDYLLQKDGELIGTTTQTTVLTAIKGGMAYDQWHPKEFFTSLIAGQKQSLQFNLDKPVSADELRYFFWAYPFADNAVQTVMIDILLDDQTTINYNLPETIYAGKWGVCCTPIGFNQLKLNDQVPAGKTAISYTVQVKTAITSIVAPYTFLIDHRNFYNATQLIFRNSAGGMETLRLRGQIDFEADYAKQLVQNTVPPSYFSNMNLLSQANDVNTAETPKFKGDTGFLNREATDKLRDFFMSAQKFELVPGDDDNKPKLLPITINTKNTKFFSNRENLITTNIEWSRAYSNEFYTPARIMPTSRVCPAMEYFNVTQINKTLLQISYALENPYDRVEIQIITSLGTQTFYFTGNARTIRQPFNNPVLGTTDTELITVRARTVCDETSIPQDLGPFSTMTLTVVGNTLPIANDDVYNIAYGYNTAVLLNGSTLANDYDPDGDLIECIIDSGATNDGGTYSITAAGIVTYLPPSSIYVGQDYFDYEIREVGGVTTVTARVYINVGTLSGKVYAKIIQRNVETTYSSTYSITTAEVWIDFFTNPAVNQPVDITPLGLTINYNERQFEQTFLGVQTTNDLPLSLPGVGTKMKIFEGAIESRYSDPSYSYEQIMAYYHTLLAGTGYIPI